MAATTGPAALMCAGAPLDSTGRPRERINDCPFVPKWLGLGLIPAPNGDPMHAVISCCDLHRPAVLEVLAADDPEAFSLPIEALPHVLDQLRGEQIWTMAPGAAA